MVNIRLWRILLLLSATVVLLGGHRVCEREREARMWILILNLRKDCLIKLFYNSTMVIVSTHVVQMYQYGKKG